MLPPVSIAFRRSVQGPVFRHSIKMGAADMLENFVDLHRSLGCHLLFSEDMGHLQIYDSVMVVNPFAEQGRWIRENPPWVHRQGGS